VASLEVPSAQGRQFEDELARFFAQSRDLFCIANLDGYFQFLNPAWMACLGWTDEELKAKPFLDFVYPADREATRAEIAKLVGGAEAILFENRYRHRDGSFRWLQWNSRLVPGSDLLYATARDVTEQKRLERDLLEIVDREKERLGRELHDGLCQSLAGIAALSATLSRRLAATSESAASATAAEIGKLLNETIRQARDMAHGLGPLGLDEVGLDGALETLAGSTRHLFRVDCTLECDPTFLRPHLVIEAQLFRIAQEAVNNAIVHGRANRIELLLSATDGEGLLSIRDDGVGMPAGATNPVGAGLHTMDYRARLIGGTLELRRRTPRGTIVDCGFPLSRAPNGREE
jgi:PAS domain S-box-containing protein